MIRYYYEVADLKLAGLLDAIRTTIPPLVKLLKDQYSDVRSTAAHTVGKLAQHGKLMQTIILTQIEWHAEGLREAISATIPPLIELLENTNPEDRVMDLNAGISAIGRLADLSEW
jgi:HEAT repeat protein